MSLPRIGILHYTAPPVIGGVESTIAAHARLFAARGYPVKVIAGRGEPMDPRLPLSILPEADSRNRVVLNAQSQLARDDVIDDFPALTRALTHALGKELQDVDICIAHNIPTLNKNLALTIALRTVTNARPIRLIAWCHDFAWSDPVCAHELYGRWPWICLRQKWAGAQYVAVSADRQKELAQLLQVPANEIAVIPAGIEMPEFLMASAAVRWTRELDLQNAAPLLLIPTRITRRKRIERAIQITAALGEFGLAAKLLVMGPLGAHNPANAEYLAELKILAQQLRLENQVFFLSDYGVVNDAARRDLYWLADVLLLPSEREGFGIPLLEAGLARLPIFCADIPPLRELAGDAAHYFAEGDSPRAVAERMRDFLKADARYQWKRRVLEHYAWERIFSERIEPLVKEVWSDGARA